MKLRLPNKVRRGEAVSHETVNALIDALQSVLIQPGVGYERKVTPGGTILRIRQANQRESVTDFAPFAVREAEKVGSDYEVTLEPGRVICPDPVEAANGNDGLRWYVPTIGGVPMDEEDADGNLPVITVPVGQAIYCRIRRGADGMISETPTMEVAAAGEDSGHYQPADPEGSGTEEVYRYHRIVEVNEDAGELDLVVWWKSDIQTVNQLWEGVNVGEGGDHYKEHDETAGTFDFRRTKGNYGANAATNGDSVEVDFDGENLNDLEGGQAVDIYKEPTPAEIAAGGPALFRQVTQGPSGRRQIEVAETGTAVQVMGNAVNGSGTVNGDAVVTAQDGLVTALGAVTVESLPSGSEGDMLYHDGTEWVVLGAPGVAVNEGWVLVHNGNNPEWLDTTVTL